MPEDGPVSIVIVCEDEPDRRIACELADRVICDRLKWITSDQLDTYRQWRGWTDGTTFLKISQVRNLAKQRRISAAGKFDGRPGADYSHAARLTFLLLLSLDPRPNAIALVVDTDDVIRGREGCRQARDQQEGRKWPFAIVLGLAHPKRECWVLSAFVPSTDEDRRKLLNLRKRLGFNPCEHSERLTAIHNHDKKSAKRVLKLLAGDDESFWQTAGLKLLTDRGQHNGLADFITEVNDRLIPLFSGHRP